MSALPDDPDHLLRWAGQAGFVSRGLYGDYLSQTLGQEERAAASYASLYRVSGTVTAMAPGKDRALRLRFEHGMQVEADVAVLASGSPPRPRRPELASAERYLANPWQPGRLAMVQDGAPVLAVGTGLTMVDVALTVSQAHPGTVIYAVSRHGLLPHRHLDDTPPHLGEIQIPSTIDLRGLLVLVRRALAGHPGDWRGVIDTLRSQVPCIWSRLSHADRELFLRRFGRYWEIHRHRMAPEVAAGIDRLRQTGRLRILRGEVAEVRQNARGFLARTGGRDLSAGWLIDCTGPSADITKTDDPLVRALLRAGLARPDPLRLGFATDGNGALLDSQGCPNERLFTLGPLRRGELYETTAIPEIREQAVAIAVRVLRAAEG
jgi:uncharacterized NAD(P)/FAD-binding protein YdhS